MWPWSGRVLNTHVEKVRNLTPRRTLSLRSSIILTSMSARLCCVKVARRRGERWTSFSGPRCVFRQLSLTKYSKRFRWTIRLESYCEGLDGNYDTPSVRRSTVHSSARCRWPTPRWVTICYSIRTGRSRCMIAMFRPYSRIWVASWP